MGMNRLSKRQNRLFVVILVAIVLGLIVFSSLKFISKANDNKLTTEEPDTTGLLQKKQQDTQESDKGTEALEVQKSGEIKDETSYLTFSNGGNVDIGVIFMNPITNEKDNLVFDNNTEYLKLVFKDIAEVDVREHLYQDETLR